MKVRHERAGAICASLALVRVYPMAPFRRYRRLKAERP